MELSNEFQAEINEMMSQYEIVIASKKLNNETQELIDKFKSNEIDVRFYDSVNAPDQPVLVLDAKHVISCADAKKLIEYQPKKGVLFYHRVEHVAYQKAEEYLFKAEHAYEEYNPHVYRHVDNDDVEITEQQKLLFEPYAPSTNVDLPY